MSGITTPAVVPAPVQVPSSNGPSAIQKFVQDKDWKFYAAVASVSLIAGAGIYYLTKPSESAEEPKASKPKSKKKKNKKKSAAQKEAASEDKGEFLKDMKEKQKERKMKKKTKATYIWGASPLERQGPCKILPFLIRLVSFPIFIRLENSPLFRGQGGCSGGSRCRDHERCHHRQVV